MSATGRGAKRCDQDYYRTPAWVVRAVLPELGRPPLRVLEPSAGDGAILDVLREAWPAAVRRGIELDPVRADICQHAGHLCETGDALARDLVGFDLAITNPPFSLAERFVEHLCSHVREVALLLRLSFLGSLGRVELFRRFPCDVLVLPRRPAFVASVSCDEKKACGWRVTLPLEDPRPKRCPECGARVNVSTSDSSEYAWFLFGPGRGGHWKIATLED